MMEFQREVLRLRDLDQQLVEEVTRLRAQLRNRAAAQASNQPNSSASAASSTPPGWTAEWNEFARQYMYLISPWRADYAFGLAAHPGIDPTSPDRYADEISMRAAQSAELYELIPPRFHPALAHANSGFADKVSCLPTSDPRPNRLPLVQDKASEHALEPSFHAYYPCRRNL